MKPGFEIDYVFILPFVSAYLFSITVIIVIIIIMSPLSLAD